MCLVLELYLFWDGGSNTLGCRSRVLHHLGLPVIARFVTFGLGTYGSFSFVNRAVLSLQKQNVVLSILKKKKRVGPTVEKKKSATTCPLWPRGERSDASSNTRNALVSMGSLGL